MSTPDEVLSASIHARRSKRVDDLTFSSVSGNGFFVTLGSDRLFEFDSIVTANQFRDQMNTAFISVKSDLRAHYQSKIDGAL